MGKIIAVFVVLLVLIGGGVAAYVFWPTPGAKVAYKGGARAVTSYPPGVPYADRFEKNEVLVSNPPVDFESRAMELGFEVVERIQLRNLSLHIYRVRIPQGSTVKKARQLLAQRIPGLNVDASHHFETQEPDELPGMAPAGAAAD
jgi:hypothetical protein